jgi:hypothetical protein
VCLEVLRLCMSVCGGGRVGSWTSGCCCGQWTCRRVYGAGTHDCSVGLSTLQPPARGLVSDVDANMTASYGCSGTGRSLKPEYIAGCCKAPRVRLHSLAARPSCLLVRWQSRPSLPCGFDLTPSSHTELRLYNNGDNSQEILG